MSPFDFILGLPGVEVIRAERGSTLQVWAQPTRRPSCMYCQSAPVRIKATEVRTLKHTRQGNRLMLLHLRVPKYHCVACNRYFRHRFAGILPRYRATECFKLEVFEAHHGGVSQRQISRTHQLGSATVERWYQGFIKQRVSELSARECPAVLGIDEHFFSRKKGYATTLVDLKNHKVFDVVLGRSEASLEGYLRRLTARDRVRVVVMDLSPTYRAIVRKYFPKAKIVADRFHVVRMVNQHLMAHWKECDAIGRKNRGLISLMRRHHWNLTPIQQARLARYLESYPTLAAMYDAKQRLMHFLLLKGVTARKVRTLLPEFMALVEQFRQSPARKMAETLSSWFEPIIRMWRFTKSNGITEGFHTKMEMLSRRAFGFRNFENYRLRVLAHCGWDGVINRV